ncbi:HAMP domain-containing sensor histidine kinase [Acinetobacter sp. 228]|uniref:sensor histidine kinase n=1 Tax=Acinetobacter sp. 228 TaxID=3114700 RepID=UPI003A891A85
MELKLLEVGQNTELLSSCRISLILGVYTSDNLLDTFCNVARKVLDVKTSIIGFHTEPYIWYSCPRGFRGLHAPQDISIPAYLLQADVIDCLHPAYAELSDYLKSLGVMHQRLVAFNLKSGQGDSLGQVVFFDDQTDLFDQEDIATVKQFAESLVNRIKLNQEHNNLKELYEQQCAQNFSKTKFFQIIAHDLRAPFHGLLGFSEVLAQERDTLDESSIQSIADYLYDNAQATYNLLESLLTWAMAEGGRFVYHPINYELKQSSKIVCSVLKSLALKKKIELIDNIPEDIKVHADINMITSVLQNLVSNALKFTPVDQGGKVILAAEMEGEQVKITIQDTGLGMTEEQMQNLFKPTLGVSVRGTAEEKGAGLGLVLCKRFIDLNHGQISVNSKEGRGTIFTVYLPMVTNDHQALVLEDLQAEQS